MAGGGADEDQSQMILKLVRKFFHRARTLSSNSSTPTRPQSVGWVERPHPPNLNERRRKRNPSRQSQHAMGFAKSSTHRATSYAYANPPCGLLAINVRFWV